MSVIKSPVPFPISLPKQDVIYRSRRCLFDPALSIFSSSTGLAIGAGGGLEIFESLFEKRESFRKILMFNWARERRLNKITVDEFWYAQLDHRELKLRLQMQLSYTYQHIPQGLLAVFFQTKALKPLPDGSLWAAVLLRRPPRLSYFQLVPEAPLAAGFSSSETWTFGICILRTTESHLWYCIKSIGVPSSITHLFACKF